MKIAQYSDGVDPDRVHFEYSLETPMSSEGLRYHAPYKIVRNEYLVWTLVSLVANVGGTLGLTLGKTIFQHIFYQELLLF